MYKGFRYDKDSVLHLYFVNNDSHRSKTKFFDVVIDINSITADYDAAAQNEYWFSNSEERATNAVYATSMAGSCTCAEAIRYNNTPLIDSRGIRVKYLKALPSPENNTTIDAIGTFCCSRPHYENDDDEEATEISYVNHAKTIYIVPNAARESGFVALRFSLRNHKTKAEFLPLTITADVLTSPIQIGFWLLTHKGDDNDGGTGKPKNNTAKTTKEPKHDKKS